MRKKLIALSLSFLFIGSIAASSLATTLQVANQTTIVNKDDDKDKNKKKKAKTSEEKAKDCKTKKSCCDKSKMTEKKVKEKSCHSEDEKGGDKK